jgi:cytochrome d ubiquinol oxidase subunit II
MNSIDNATIYERSKKQLVYNAVPFLVFFLYFVIALLFKDGFAYDPKTGAISVEAYKYLHNLLALPLNTIVLLVGVVGVLYGLGTTVLKGGTKGIWFAGGGTVLTVWALLILAAFNNTSFYPSIFDLQSSLTIENASSSRFTLVAMSYVSLFVPFVLAYIWYAWKSMNNKPMTTDELEKEHHVY